MRKLLLLLALLAGLGGAAAVAGVCYVCPHLPARLYHKVVFGEDYVGPGVQFKRRMAGGGRTAKGQRFSFSRFNSSDCVDVEFLAETHGSSEQAKERMEELVRSASDVVERNEKLYLNGERAGPRAVLLFRRKAMIVWTAENRVVTLESASLPHALEYEKRYASRVAPSPDWGNVLKRDKESSRKPRE